MKRDLAALERTRFDAVIIGGGITGACIARDAARRGLVVALIDMSDFSSGTSAGSSKLVHGGVRYLGNREFRVVRESLKERRIWQAIAPHQVSPMPFLVPVIPGRTPRRSQFSVGLSLYDLLAYDRNRALDPEQRLPRHRWLTRAEAIAREPALDGTGLKGGFVYHDCMMLSPERIGVECVIDAVEHGAAAANYVRANGLIRDNGRIAGVRARDELTGADFDIRAGLVVNAAGPWVDGILGLTSTAASGRRLIRSKGAHLIVPPIARSGAIAVTGRGAHVFVIPWRGVSLIGTTDTAYGGEPGEVRVEEADIETLLGAVRGGLPSVRLDRDQVLHAYAALRPLVGKDGAPAVETYRASRRAEIIDHGQGADGEGLISVLGGKWTTSRLVAERAVDLIAVRLGRRARHCETHVARLPYAPAVPFAFFATEPSGPFARVPRPIYREWRHSYGGRMDRVLDAGEQAIEPLAPGLTTTAAEIVHAVRHEMALRLADVVMRRTALGALGQPTRAVLSWAAALMGKELGWSEERVAREIAATAAMF